MNLKPLFCGALLLAAASLAPAAEKPVWTWQEPDTELYQPSFSQDGKEIALVRKRHIPDYAEAEGLSEDERKKRSAPIEKNERHADPEVIILKIGDKTPTRVDWGWSPAFSPDGSQIAFAFQKKPISRFRILAETMAGNDIRLFRRADNSIRVLAEPRSGYLDGPVFSPDGSRIVYSFCDAINGAYGGDVGVGQASLDDQSGEPLYDPAKDFGLFHLISAPRFVGDRVLVVRSKPLAAGTYLSDKYSCELLDLGPPLKSLYTWKNQKAFAEVHDFAITPEKNVLVFDTAWRGITASPEPAKKDGDAEKTGSLSPDSRLMTVMTDSGLEIVHRASGKTLRKLAIPGRIQAAAWSPDSRRLAVITTKGDEENFETDVLRVYEIQP